MIIDKVNNPANLLQHSSLLITSLILVTLLLTGCGPSTEELEVVDYTPLSGEDWKVSTPAEQGMDPLLVAKLYYNAAELETLYGLMVVKNGYLIAEGYFNEGAVDRKYQQQSVTKSYTSALVGIALDPGSLTSLDLKMMDFFPELAGQIIDPRKEQRTIQDLLQMRAGYPFEEIDPAIFEALLLADYLYLFEGFPLTSDPGNKFNYSNLTSHWLGAIVAKACGTDLKSFALEQLFPPLDVDLCVS